MARNLSMTRLLFLVVLGFVVSTGVATNAQSAEMIYNSFNAAGVYNGPTVDTTFTLTKPTTIAAIINYHWNGQAGQDAGAVNGWIGIEQIVSGTENVVIGRWPAVSKSGAYGAPNTWWYVYPNVPLAPGTYKIVDSDPATWSYADYSYYGIPDGPDWAPSKGFTYLYAAATVTATDPVNGATGVGLMQPVTITFSENVVPGPAWDMIEIVHYKNNVKKQKVKSNAPVTKTLNGNVLVILPTENYQDNALMTVILPAGSVEDNGLYPPGSTNRESDFPAGAYQYTFSTVRK